MATHTPVPVTDTPAVPPTALRDPPTFLAEMYRLAAAGQEDAAMDTVFDHVNTLLMAGLFAHCDQLLRTVEVEKLPPVLLISFLTITAAARSKLAERVAYYGRAKTEITRRRGEEAAARLLAGLE
jgi:hypothetical protein